MRIFERPLHLLFARVDVAPLVYTRIAFGILMFVEMWRFYSHGWIDRYYVEPTFFFSYPGFGWVTPLPAAGMYALFVAMGVLAALIALGLFYRVAALLFAVAISYVFLLDQTNYLNHLYLICLFAFLLAVVPAAGAGSLDALRRGRADGSAPAWTLWLLRFQIAVVYVFGGIAKLDGDWLGGVPAKSFLENANLTVLAQSELACVAFALGGLLFDLLIVPALLWRRTRWLAVCAALTFHLINFKLFRIGIFPWFMMALIPLFWPPAWTRRILASVRILSPEPAAVESAAPPESATSATRARHRWIAAALAGYAALQVLVPLRHFLYRGEVNWTEEGHNFSWHMKLRSKAGHTEFVVVDQRTKEIQEIDPRHHLTRRQVRKMSTRPELVRQFARELARRQRSQGRTDVTVHALARATLNGRRVQLLVDPRVDLGRTDRSLRSSPWIVPLGDHRAAVPLSSLVAEGD